MTYKNTKYELGKTYGKKCNFFLVLTEDIHFCIFSIRQKINWQSSLDERKYRKIIQIHKIAWFLVIWSHYKFSRPDIVENVVHILLYNEKYYNLQTWFYILNIRHSFVLLQRSRKGLDLTCNHSSKTSQKLSGKCIISENGFGFKWVWY